MALNLSTLTNPATSGDVLAEALTTADFLEPVPVLRNLARGSQKGGDAKQSVSLNQPRALPLDANGKGYCYLPVTTGNAPAVTFPAIGSSDDFVLEMDVYLVDVSSLHLVSGSSQQERIIIYNSGSSFQCNVGNAIYVGSLTLLTEGVSTITVERTSGTVTLKQNGVTKGTINNVTGSATFSHLSFNGQFSTGVPPLNGYIQTCTLSIEGTEQLNIDFTATNVRHGDTKFKCATGQVVTINQDSSSSNDVATIIKKPVLRFDGANSSLQGLFANNIDSGYMFAAFTVLGDGGGVYGRVLSVNNAASPALDYSNPGGIFSIHNNPSPTTDLSSFHNSAFLNHSNMFDPENGDVLHEVKIQSGSNLSRVNQAGLINDNRVSSINSDVFNISQAGPGGGHVSLDLEYLALFTADSVPDEATAKRIRDYINGRGVHPIFSLIDSAAFYFYDATRAPSGAISSGSSAWSGRIVGSDNGDSASIEATQATANDQPVGDGYVVTFADNTDHLDIPSTSQAGWQVVGTSLGCFMYRVDSDSISGLHLLGNDADYDDGTTQRKNGQLYGIMLLPLSATSADLNEAKKLLIDRGASEEAQASGSQYYAAWYQRRDIVEFPAHTFPNATTLQIAWRVCNSMTDFGAIQAPLCTNFTSAWQGTTALQSFPAGAKLGTEAENVNFSNAWRSSGLTSFSTPLPTANLLIASWRDCSSMTSFSVAELPLVTDSRQSFLNCNFSAFSTEMPKSKAFQYCWSGNSSLTDFSSDVFANWNPVSLYDSVFDLAWDGCTSLTAVSVENILVGISNSGKFATSDGNAYVNGVNTQLADTGIDISFDTATGSLSAATNTAVSALKGRGWSIIVNNVTL